MLSVYTWICHLFFRGQIQKDHQAKPESRGKIFLVKSFFPSYEKPCTTKEGI